MTVHTLCKLMLAAMVPALALPGLVATRSARSLTSALLLLQVRGRYAYYRVLRVSLPLNFAVLLQVRVIKLDLNMC